VPWALALIEGQAPLAPPDDDGRHHRRRRGSHRRVGGRVSVYDVSLGDEAEARFNLTVTG
jgi:hypothetical protein